MAVDTMTRTQVRDEFRRQGVRISAWASDRGYPPQLVYALLAGRIRGDYGQAHRIAVDLRIKSPEPSVAGLNLAPKISADASPHGGQS